MKPPILATLATVWSKPRRGFAQLGDTLVYVSGLSPEHKPGSTFAIDKNWYGGWSPVGEA